ncbi:MAG: type II secretion system F family protein [Bacillota bacterium]|uniref:Type II secretion system F family protein n=1 Tax=Virgibacillus salarius TaxID=447199 RepID=A0A941DTK8_9BACI|nr:MULTISPECIES: type II secretion system F family protein [Bacillaceae]NAZ09114.1 type II secretion system protein [Agaribacter marinus]MBR7796405.1 type II secretion system F family protein [Virgibacillus salarius]MCC2250980.1 type II secretion system F family protein [Virgibacillus sp. AGTR]MDY7045172.1 type II secretion system F family protein [Virgibacillus sp. M23]QRZ19731.1 type II secretion system F family protein [Virgibacillus sp. AGTR]
MILKSILMVILLIIIGMNLKYKKVYESFISSYKEDITLPIIAPYALAIIDKLNLYKRMPKLINSIHQKMIILKGSKLSADHTKIYLAKIITTITLAVFFTMVYVELDGGGYTNLIYGLILTGILGFYLVKDLDKKVRQRKDSIVIELPEFVNKVILLVNAGDTVQGAIKKCVDQNKQKVFDSPLYFELNEAVNKMSANTPFQEVMKDLNYRCGIQEVSIFTTTVMMNYRKGGALLVQSLKELSVSLWDKRKTITRIKGEEASSKLVFPIIFIFGAVLLIVIYPAIAIF